MPADQTVAETAPTTTPTTNTAGAYGSLVGTIGSSLADAGHAVIKFGSEATTSVKEVAKAGGRLTLATFGLFVSAWNGLSRTTAASTGLIADGYGKFNGLAGHIPVVNDFASGVGKAIDGLSKTYKENSDFNSKNRSKMISVWRTDLNNYHPQSSIPETRMKTSEFQTAVSTAAESPAAESKATPAT